MAAVAGIYGMGDDPFGLCRNPKIYGQSFHPLQHQQFQQHEKTFDSLWVYK